MPARLNSGKKARQRGSPAAPPTTVMQGILDLIFKLPLPLRVLGLAILALVLAGAAAIALLPERTREAIALAIVANVHHSKPASIPTITIQGVPSKGGGSITGAAENLPTEQLFVVVYAHTDHWYVQPDLANALTPIGADHSWSVQTQGGNDYVVLLVRPAYRPIRQMDTPPTGGMNVLASAVVEGK